MMQGLVMSNLILGLMIGCIVGYIACEARMCNGAYNWDNGVCNEIE